jgi:hypothetical protein
MDRHGTVSRRPWRSAVNPVRDFAKMLFSTLISFWRRFL